MHSLKRSARRNLQRRFMWILPMYHHLRQYQLQRPSTSSAVLFVEVLTALVSSLVKTHCSTEKVTICSSYKQEILTYPPGGFYNFRSTARTSHRISEIRVLQIRHIFLTHLPTNPLLLFLADPTFLCLAVSPSVLQHIIRSPQTDQDELGGKTDSTSYSARNIPWGIFCLEDLGAGHVAHALEMVNMGIFTVSYDQNMVQLT